MQLSKGDLMDMRITSVGEKVFIMNSLDLLRKSETLADRDKVQWTATMPFDSVSYYDSFSECCQYKLCGCMFDRTVVEVTATGVTEKRRPPETCTYCSPVKKSNNFDLRFMKTIDWTHDPRCMCFCRRAEMVLAFETDGEGAAKLENLTVAHPHVNERAVKLIRALWAEARLVSE